jgi:hypothetical protein
VYTTTDFGKSFRSIAANLPTGAPDFVHVIRQDLVNPDLLFVGTDVGAYVSVNRGRTWHRFMAGLPTVPVHDLRIHPRDHELIAGTHGRAIWIADITALQQIHNDAMVADAWLFEPRTAWQFGDQPTGGQGMGGASPGQKIFLASVPSYGAEITYRLAARGNGPTHIVIQDVTGDTLRTINGPATPGVHSVTWDFRGKQPASPTLSPAQKRDSTRTALRVAAVFDSLAQAGVDTAALGRFRRLLTSGQGGFGGRGGGGGPGGGGPPSTAWNPRPGELTATGRGGGGGGGGGGGLAGLAEQAGISDPDLAFQVIQAISGPGGGNPFGGGRGGGGFGFGARQGPIVEPGDYLVSVTVNGKTLKQKLRVERASGTGDSGSPFEEEH